MERASISASVGEPKPIKVGEEVDVEITSTGSRGDGVAKVEGYTIFVKGAQEGDRCRIRINRCFPNFAIADRLG